MLDPHDLVIPTGVGGPSDPNSCHSDRSRSASDGGAEEPAVDLWAITAARVERTLPSVAFDVGFDFDVDLDFDLDFRVATNARTTVEERRLSAA